MRQHPSLIGHRYGQLTVIEQAPSNTAGKRQWICRCDCGGTHTVTTGNLKSGHTSHCGCQKSPDLAGQVFGWLTVVGRSEKRSPRGARTSPTWECRCICGNITYKAKDSLTNPDLSMCSECAAKYAAEKARAGAGFVEGTQLSRIRNINSEANNASGFRGVYYDKKTNKYRARLRFKGKIMSFGSYTKIEDAVSARKAAEEEYFGTFLEKMNQAE